MLVISVIARQNVSQARNLSLIADFSSPDRKGCHNSGHYMTKTAYKHKYTGQSRGVTAAALLINFVIHSISEECSCQLNVIADFMRPLDESIDVVKNGFNK